MRPRSAEHVTGDVGAWPGRSLLLLLPHRGWNCSAIAQLQTNRPRKQLEKVFRAWPPHPGTLTKWKKWPRRDEHSCVRRALRRSGVCIDVWCEAAQKDAAHPCSIGSVHRPHLAAVVLPLRSPVSSLQSSPSWAKTLRSSQSRLKWQARCKLFRARGSRKDGVEMGLLADRQPFSRGAAEFPEHHVIEKRKIYINVETRCERE